MKKISILGSTGSIGTQALEVIDRLQGFEVLALSAGKNIKKLKEQIAKYKPKTVSVEEKSDADELKLEFPNLNVLYGEEGLIQITSNPLNDLVLTATSGIVAMKPTLCAIENGIDIALANKETLVIAGDIVMNKAKEKGVKILPVDSEHSAIFQCAGDFSLIEKIIITASGGPFLNKTKEEMEESNAQDALKHPRWNMGRKITIDSATLMNKGLEVIEAHHLFNMPYDKIDVVIHKESIVHSAVEFKDGSTIAQLGNPSMHIPIQYALTYPKREYGIESKSFNFIGKTLTFEKPDFDKFECLKLALEAGKIGGSMPCVLCIADEIAVSKFLKGDIKISDIPKIVEGAMKNHNVIKNPSLDDLFGVIEEIRKTFI